MNLKLQILAPILLYLLVWLVYATILQVPLGWTAGTIFGFFCALVATVSIAIVVAAWRAGRQERQILETRKARPRVSGSTVFCGVLEGVIGPAEAPLSGRSCLAWEYEFETSGLDDGGKVDPDLPFEWFGLGQVSLEIAMPYGKIPIRAGAMFEEPEKELIARGTGVSRAQALQERPSLKVVSSAFHLGRMLSDLDELFADEDGGTRLDYVRGPWTPNVRMSPAKQMYERCVEPGSVVTVAGHFDIGSGAVVASRDGVLIATVEDSILEEKAPFWRRNLGVLLVTLAFNLVMHALVTLAWLNPL